MISAVLPIMSLYKLPHGQYAYTGHVINLPQDVASFANSLPRLPSELDVEKDLVIINNNYDRICAENRELNAIFNKQKRDKEKRVAREQALKDAREKARVEEEERQAVKVKYEKRRREDIQFEEFLDFKRKRYN